MKTYPCVVGSKIVELTAEQRDTLEWRMLPVEEKLARLQGTLYQAKALITECQAALAEELAAWDIDPPLHHVKQAHDRCTEWLAAHGRENSP